MEGYGDGTLCVRPGDSKWSKTLCLAAVNEFSSIEEFAGSEFVYRRYGSPNVHEMGAAVARLEEAEAGIATASGMGAILLAILAVCKQGDKLLASADAYGGTYDLLSNDMHRFGIHVRLENIYDTGVLDSILEQLILDDNNSSSSLIVVLVESISNPLIKLADVAQMSRICKKHKALLLVDNTFSTPLRIKPLKQGADMVVHSATKFLCGHSDATAGAIVSCSEHVSAARAFGRSLGTCCFSLGCMAGVSWFENSPGDICFSPGSDKVVCLRFQVRMQRSWMTAALLAKRLEESGIKVRSAAQCSMLAIEVPGGLPGVEAALRNFRIIKLSPSLGGTSTTVSHSATSSHKAMPPEMRLSLGITDGLLRISVGLEDPEDVWADIQQGLKLIVAPSTVSAS